MAGFGKAIHLLSRMTFGCTLSHGGQLSDRMVESRPENEDVQLHSLSHRPADWRAGGEARSPHAFPIRKNIHHHLGFGVGVNSCSMRHIRHSPDGNAHPGRVIDPVSYTYPKRVTHISSSIYADAYTHPFPHANAHPIPAHSTER
jgi:hypothetical protein